MLMRIYNLIDRRKIVTELKELVELYRFGYKPYIASTEEIDLKKCKKLIRKVSGICDNKSQRW